MAVGRRAADLRALGVQDAGVTLNDRGAPTPDAQLRIGDGMFVAGDAAGGLQFTHVADYEGRVTARAALGSPLVADLRTVPKATFTDPEAASVGMLVEEAQAAGIDAFEVSQDFGGSARGQTIEDRAAISRPWSTANEACWWARSPCARGPASSSTRPRSP